jgi:hypothetical protein
MRYLLPLVVIACGLAPAAARADTTLRYVPEVDGGLSMTIEIDAQGRIRAETSGGLVLIIREGATYIMVGHADHAMARIEDAAAIAVAARALRPASTLPPRTPAHFTVVAHGPQNVGQRAGTTYRLAASPAIPGAVYDDIVVSTDPALIPPGHAVAQIIAARCVMLDAAIGIIDVDMFRATNDVLERGLLLRMADQRLDSLNNDPIPASHFELPGPLLTRERLRARPPEQP